MADNRTPEQREEDHRFALWLRSLNKQVAELPGDEPEDTGWNTRAVISAFNESLKGVRDFG